MKEHTDLPGEIEPHACEPAPAPELEPARTTPTDGKWVASTSEENWSSTEEFDTREKAIAYAISELAVENGLEDGDHFYTGQVARIDLDDLAGHVADADNILDQMAERLYDLVGEHGEDQIDCTKAQGEDLERRVTAAIREWMTAIAFEVRCWQIEHTKSEVWHQCEARHDEHDNPRGRCIRHLDHEGEHEWP